MVGFVKVTDVVLKLGHRENQRIVDANFNDFPENTIDFVLRLENCNFSKSQ